VCSTQKHHLSLSNSFLYTYTLYAHKTTVNMESRRDKNNKHEKSKIPSEGTEKRLKKFKLGIEML
jgi:hypothetical protein